MTNVWMRFILVLAAALAACAHEPRSYPKFSESEYRIGREDVLEIVVYGDGGLTRTVPVRPDGKIVLPLCGEMPVAGLTARETASKIKERLEKWMQDPRVSVVVREVNAARVYVLGEVHRPGAVPLRSRMTLLAALSAAGGLTEWADSDDIVLLRNAVDGKVERWEIDLEDAVDGDEDASFELAPGDTIYVP